MCTYMCVLCNVCVCLCAVNRLLSQWLRSVSIFKVYSSVYVIVYALICVHVLCLYMYFILYVRITNWKKTHPSSSQLKLSSQPKLVVDCYNQIGWYMHIYIYAYTYIHCILIHVLCFLKQRPFVNKFYICIMYCSTEFYPSKPIMCCYKLVTCEFIWWGLQGRVESLIQKVTTWLPLLCIYDTWTVGILIHIHIFVVWVACTHVCL